MSKRNKRRQKAQALANSIMLISPYEHNGMWVFDDAPRGLLREPFVAGIPTIINEALKAQSSTAKRFNLTFSGRAFPGSQAKLVWDRTDGDGNWYKLDGFDFEGWLCPALLKFFPKAPKEIHCQISFA